MFCFPGDAVPPPTPKSQVLVKVLKWLFVFNLIVCVPKVLFSVWSCLMELIGCIYLYFAYSQLNYCNCVVYNFFCLMNIVNILSVLGSLIQQNVVLLSLDPKTLLILADSGLSFTLYVIAIHFAFQGYKEFKGIALDVIKASSSDHGVAMTNPGEIDFQRNVMEFRTPKKDLQYL